MPKTSRMPNRTGILSFIMVDVLAFVVLCHLGLFITEASGAQKFYPNGRYGRRSVLPPLLSLDDNSEDMITFIGNVASRSNKLPNPISSNQEQPITLLCFTMARSQLLRCALRESSDALERSNSESQQ